MNAPPIPLIPFNSRLQMRLWSQVTGTFAKTNFFGGSAPFDNDKILEGCELYSVRDNMIRPLDPKNGYYLLKCILIYLIFYYMSHIIIMLIS